MFHCKTCPEQEFEALSDLRKHQWAAHPERYKTVGFPTNKRPKPGTAAHKRWRESISKGRRRQKESVTDYVGKALTNGNMSVDELLEEFETQRKFLDDVISLVTEIRNRK